MNAIDELINNLIKNTEEYYKSRAITGVTDDYIKGQIHILFDICHELQYTELCNRLSGLEYHINFNRNLKGL